MQTRTLTSIAEIIACVESCLVCPDVQVQATVEQSALVVVLNLMPCGEFTYVQLGALLQQHLRGVSMPHLRQLVMWGRQWGETECEWQMTVDLPLLRQLPDVQGVVLPPIPKKYRNVMEELVTEAVQRQAANIEDDYVKEIFNHHQAIAYALNRLQPLYVTTEEGWLRQRNYAIQHQEMIERVVAQAVQVVAATPRSASSNLDRSKPRTSAQVLARLAKLMGKQNLRWRDLPDTLQRKLDSIKPYRRYSSAYEIRSYLKRAKLRQAVTPNAEMYLVDFGIVETDWFKVYMSAAVGDYVNVLEQLVGDGIAMHQPPTDLNMDEVVAYALNRLPAMYATSQEGITILRQVATTQMAARIDQIVEEAIEFIASHPRSDVHPLPFDLFEKELEFALQEVRQILNRPDLTWENLDEVLKLEFTQRDITIPHNFR